MNTASLTMTVFLVSFGGILSANATITLTGSQLAGLGLSVPARTVGDTGSASYGNGQITLTSGDNVGGGGENQFLDTAQITVNNGYDGIMLGTVNSFLAGDASFDLKSATAGGGQYAYWDVLVSNGIHTYQINTYGDNTLGVHPFNSSRPNMDFPVGTPWTTLAATYGSYNVLAITIDVGGWDTGPTRGPQTDVIDSITLPDDAVPEPPTIIVAGLLLLPLGGSIYRILRKRRGV